VVKFEFTSRVSQLISIADATIPFGPVYVFHFELVAILNTDRFILSILTPLLSNSAIRLEYMQAALPPNIQGVE